jgi:major membrane immunogen (membrane-anchored lipoprotein)
MNDVEYLIRQFVDGLILDMDADPDEIINGLTSTAEAVRKQHNDSLRKANKGWTHDE